MTTYAVITDENGTREVDLSAVDEIIGPLIDAIRDDSEDPLRFGKAAFEASQRLRDADLSEEQLRLCADNLITQVVYFARMWKMSLTRKHYEFLGQMLELRDLAATADPPVDLWPSLDGDHE